MNFYQIKKDIQNLIEFVNEVDNSFLKSSDIQDLIKTMTFKKNITKKNIQFLLINFLN